MRSNLELLKTELTLRKRGYVQETLNKLAVEFNRNRLHLKEDLKLLEDVGFVATTPSGSWMLVEAEKPQKEDMTLPE